VYPQRLFITAMAVISAYLLAILLLFAARHKEAIFSALKDE
jgi:hypothetical protein